MEPKLWQKIDTLARQALEEADRAAFLDELGGSDPSLRREVEARIRTYERARWAPGTMLSKPGFTPPTSLDVGVGDRIGPYRLHRKLGESATSTVFLATRDSDPDGLSMAVKLGRPRFDLHLMARRFRIEEEALARLDHPGIPRFHASGTLADGRPYLVSEHVDGEPIDGWCSARRLPRAARMALVAVTCDVVEHFHRAGLLHRDLKPAHLLINPEGRPRVIDFGSALRVADGDSDPAAPDRPMTPLYASPELLRGEPLGTTSDIYSLGVILYLLLADRLPYGEGTDPGPREMARRLEAGPPPSLGSDPLDKIVRQTLAHDPTERIPSAALLARALRGGSGGSG